MGGEGEGWGPSHVGGVGCPPNRSITNIKLTTLYKLKYSPSDITNKMAHTVNGNLIHGIRMITWNKGNTFLENSQESIQLLIKQQKPHILSIHEARLRQCVPLDDVKIPGYDIHVDGLYKAGKTGREVVYTSTDLTVKYRSEFTGINGISMKLIKEYFCLY